MTNTPQKGPWAQRFLVHVFTLLFGLLAFWLLGFVIDDISHWSGPDYRVLEEKMLDEALTKEEERLRDEISDIQRNINDQQARQRILRDSTDNAQTTMNQLLEFQRLSLEKGVTPTEEEQIALAESQNRFLTNQSQYQDLTQKIAELQEQLRELELQQRMNQEQLEIARKPIREEFQRLQRIHDLQIASLKLAVLTPLLIVAVLLFLRNRESLYVPLVAAFAIAVAVKVILVMHQYFPARYFKYVLIITFLAIVTRALVSLIRMIAFPNPEWLSKQFREAYEAFLCPICDFPIRRGPLKYMFWTRRSIKKLRIPATEETEPESPYSCPACGTGLYEPCNACGKIRHALLPTCEHCGNSRPVQVTSNAEQEAEPTP